MRINAVSLTEDYLQSPPPIFIQTNPRDLNLRREVFQECVCRGMKAQPRSDQPYERRPRIKFDARKIAVALKIAFALVAPHSQPIIDCLYR